MHMISSVSSRSPLTPPNSSPPSAASHHHHPEHSNQLKMTNFSIAAIMNNNNSRKEDEEEDSCSGGTSHRGGSLNSSTFGPFGSPPLSRDRSAIKTELEEEVDVEQCSDGEGAEKEPPPPRIPTHSDSNHAHTSANTTTTNITGSKKKKKDEKTKAMKPKCNSPELLSVDCHLETKELWDKFHELGTEMIITKTGRRMFPTVRCSFTNLRPDRKYWVILDIVPCDNKRYRYAYHRSSWLVAGKADPPPPHRFYIHPDSPFTGDQLRKQVVSFEKVKLTNNEMDKNGQVILNSMHRFQPRIYLVIRPEGASGPVTDIELCRYRSYIYPETIFTAVTAYQNQLITKLKIDSNPFAKGFRDSSRLNDYEGDSYGLLPGLDPAFLLRSPLLSDAENNNLMVVAAEKARAIMLMNGRGGHPPHHLGFFPPLTSGNSPSGVGPPSGPGYVPHPGLLMGSPPTSLPQLYTLNAASRENPSPLSLFSQWSAVQAAGLLASSSSTITNTTSTPSSSPPTSSGSSSCVPSRPSPFSSSLRFSPYILPPSKGGSFNTANVCGSGGRDPSPSRLSPPTSEGIPSSTPSP
ncbi:T-box transcription factor TBX1 isoform X2 [Lepeophtheirus salmonis]|uniref:T-box transcription factor TBX1 isoform X2 n=1 Tax=Lepeophtheirus salmonis TaxID=72036 RepID=UPI001AE577DA|nr:T-box transcription factor TBX20-like isoform X2 [Lepeophtheirus salmonis]